MVAKNRMLSAPSRAISAVAHSVGVAAADYCQPAVTATSRSIERIKRHPGQEAEHAEPDIFRVRHQSPIAERFTCQGGEIYELVGTHEKK